MQNKSSQRKGYATFIINVEFIKNIPQQKGDVNMNEIELLKIDKKDLENAIDNLSNALMNLKEIEGTDKEFADIDTIMQILEDKLSDIKIKINNFEEEAYYKENEEQWKSEQREQDYEYERSKF